VKSGGGGFEYGGGNRYGGGYDERDGETMMTTPNVVFGGDNFPPAAKPEPPINTKAAESTAFVVLVTAATLIIIVLIILLVLKVKYRTDTNRYLYFARVTRRNIMWCGVHIGLKLVANLLYYY
jgi:heme/copper-type cytochrome/quinol oxidase subunit 2